MSVVLFDEQLVLGAGLMRQCIPCLICGEHNLVDVIIFGKDNPCRLWIQIEEYLPEFDGAVVLCHFYEPISSGWQSRAINQFNVIAVLYRWRWEVDGVVKFDHLAAEVMIDPTMQSRMIGDQEFPESGSVPTGWRICLKALEA